MASYTPPLTHPYVDGPPRQVPCFAGLHRMMTMLLAERVPEAGRVLVLGAGGGLELETLAEAQSGWQFVGVDPSPDMLDIARKTAAAHLGRIDLVQGTVDVAPEGPFDAATCLLTFHFIPRDQRPETLRQIRRRLKPGAPFVLAHISITANEPDRSAWLGRHVAFGANAPLDPAQIEKSREMMATRLTILPPEEEEAMLAEAGFSGISLFYAAFSCRGWVAYAG